ncbi:catalase [Nocardioides caldifontis]|uniref:catalase n=1 Tax=Nocardioides caldifontis TaxID=2588938 RepID=UPI0011DF291A|nr:catalase [Nocardioides caldifontis]
MSKPGDGLIPGVPAPEPPSLEEPTQPRGPLPPKPDQGQPKPSSPTGADVGAPPTAAAQQGEHLTTATGVRVRNTDHSLKAGRRGPTLLQDHHLREKIMHFDHERIPERVVHARGAGAHGVFEAYGSAENVCKAAVFKKGEKTPVFVRFSTVLGSRGSADTVRDTRGFATKFYTREGNWDLVANNIPVFFIQDGIKFPDIIHAGKPHPDREIPQAQSAHDTFYDFVSLHTEATHHVMWNNSDRGIPRSYRMMEGFGVHTFRMVNDKDETVLVKFHWKPKLGTHALVWEEAQLAAGVDPDFHRRDLYDSIEAGAYPQWELGIQVMPDTEDEMFAGIDLLDSTKIVPEELAEVQPVGLLTLNRNPTNFFAEVEQIAFHTGHLVPGIDATNDPLLQARNFSYLDTQLTRLAGPNFNQIPINRPHAGVNDMFRDGFHQHAVHGGVAPYQPNSLDGGNPFPTEERSFVDIPVKVAEGPKVRDKHVSFDDHFSQPRLFWKSMTPIEKTHIIEAFTFELGKCYEQAIKERELLVLAQVDPELCAGVAAGLGLPCPPSPELPDVEPSEALSMVTTEAKPDGRIIGIVVDVDDPSTLKGLDKVRATILGAGGVPYVVAKHGGELPHGLMAQRTFATVRSIELDAVLVAGAPQPPASTGGGPDANPIPTALDGRVAVLLQEAFRHGKAIGCWGDGATALEAAGIATSAPGIAKGSGPAATLTEVMTLMKSHRVWERFVPASS